MKKYAIAIISILLVLCLAGCSAIQKPATLIGTVEEVYDASILVNTDIGPCVVSLPEGENDFSPGDTVEISFSGEIAESYPMQIHHVYAIRRLNDKGN